MIRKFSLSLKDANVNKTAMLREFHAASVDVLNYYITKFWPYASLSWKCLRAMELDAPTWLSKRAQWIRLYCLGRSLSAWLPAHRYEYLNEFLADGWTLNKSASLRLGPDGTFYVDITLEKPAPAKRTTGRTVGADLGYRKALVTSDGTILGAALPEHIATICSKQRGSKAHHRAVVEKNQYIRTELNRLDTSDLQTLVVEDLFRVFDGTKIGHKVMNRLQYWSYAGALKKLADRAERECFTIARVNPAYTSQRCSQCGWIDPHNRKLEAFKCVKCHYTADADLNASLNILARYEAQELTVPEIKEINNVL